MNALVALLLVVALLASTSSASAEVTPNPLFGDHAVLQQGMPVPIWGTASPGERVTVEIAGQSVSATTTTDHKWSVRLAPMKAGGPHTLTISGKNKLTLTDVLVGEVWVCGGQSNMERQLGPRRGQPPITGWQQEVAAANHPQIRQFTVAQKFALAPQATAEGSWSVCSPDTVPGFTAVGYFFGRDLHKARHVPVGLIHSSWGGTAAEAWTSEASLHALPEFAAPLAAVKRLSTDPEGARREGRARQDAWYAANDPGTAANPPWSAAELDTSAWKPMKLPANWESAGYENFDGVFWFRRAFDLPQDWNGADVEMHLGAIDDVDSTWVNGQPVGATVGWDKPRVYQVPAGLLKRRGNVVAVRVLDTGAGGGLWGGDDEMRLMVKTADGTSATSLAGPWLCRPGVSLGEVVPPPVDFSQGPNAPTVLYNGMIAPLLPYGMRGVIWYQGESNAGRERQYRTLFPALIADWRRAWGEGDFPFLFVQVAPYGGLPPELREAQLLAWQHTTNTAMAVTTDCGDASDIHPANKRPVGARLALAARALAYGEPIEYSGPVFESMEVKGAKAVLRFTHLGGGLVAKHGALKGFTVAGVDKVFRPAKASIRGDTVVVSANGVAQPATVRYAWANVPAGNLFNREGLPASPFRTDVD